MKSFLRYCIDAGLNEMTIRPIDSLRQAKDPDEKTNEKRKVPIHGDWDDILYLHQFPPSFWAQALVHRYGERLFKSEKEAKNNRRTKATEDVILKDSHGPVLFRNIKTGAGKLHEKLTKDVDDIAFSQMEKTPEHRDSYQGGHYGIDLTGEKKHKQLHIGEGYIGLTLAQAKKFLHKWFKGVNQGWLGANPKNTHRQSVRKGAEDRLVHSFESMETHPMRGKRFHLSKDGKGQWHGYRIEDGEVADEASMFTEHLPALLPAVSVGKHAHDTHNRLKKIATAAHSSAEKMVHALEANPNMPLGQALKTVSGEFGSEEEFNDALAIIDPVHRELMKRKYDKLELRMAKHGPAKQGQYVSIKDYNKIKSEMEHIEYIAGLGDSFDREFSSITPENVPVVLTWVGDELHKRADQIKKHAPRFDAHDWNLHKFSTLKNDPNDPYSGFMHHKLHHKNMIGFGTFNTNKQQKERLHAGVLTRGERPENLRDELMPYLVQAGTQSASGEPDDAHIPYTLTRPDDSRRLNKKKKLTQENRRRSPLAVGINRFLQKPSTFGDSAAFIAMKNNWWLMFQNAADDLWGRIGSREFLDYLDAKELDDVDHIEASLQNLEKFAEQIGENYARSIYQVTKRQQQTSLDQPVGKGQTLGDLLAQEDNKIHDATKKLAYDRVLRGAESESHTTGHDISELKKVIDNLAAAAMPKTAPSENPSTMSQQANMMKSIVDAGVAFQAFRDYHIWNKIAEKKAKIKRGETTTEEDEWTMQDANAYAAGETEKYQAEKGLPAYGGQITAATSRSIKSLAEKERQEERSLRERIRRAEMLGTAQGIETKEDAVVSTAVTFLDKLRGAATDEERTKYLRHLFTIAQGEPPESSVHEIVRGVLEELGSDYIEKLGVKIPNMGAVPSQQMTPEVQRMLKLSVNPKFVATLSKGAPQFNPSHRNAFEQWVQKKYPGWEKLHQALERADLGETG